MGLFRCLHCGREFEAKAPACEACGLDPRKDPRDAALVLELTVVHLDPPAAIRGRGRGVAACDPKKRVGGGAMFSGEPGAVNCPGCRASAEWQALDAAGGPGAVPVLKLGNLEAVRKKAGAG